MKKVQLLFVVCHLLSLFLSSVLLFDPSQKGKAFYFLRDLAFLFCRTITFSPNVEKTLFRTSLILFSPFFPQRSKPH